MPIQILPARLANQIAAGEVVERPASVVKELVENSLDSGASKIEIEIEKGGHKRILIRDNGSGIPKDELGLSLSRHATSKISCLEDLEAIASLGFRGEALASISSVSRLSISSKPKAQGQAWQASCEGRDMAVNVQPVAHPDGTSVDVVDLFFNTPARRKFLKTEKTEFAHIDELIRRIALSRFDVEFVLKHNGKRLRRYPAVKQSSDHSKRLEAVCTKAFVEQGFELKSEYQDYQLSGWIQPSDSDSPIQYFYVNGRMMRDKLINHAMRQAVEESCGDSFNMGYVIYLTLPPEQVDVNVHPAKHEVRFHQARLVHDFIFRALVDGLDQWQNNEPQTSPVLEPVAPNHDYITPLRQLTSETIKEAPHVYQDNQSNRANLESYQSSPSGHTSGQNPHAARQIRQSAGQVRQSAVPSQQAQQSYQALMSVPEQNHQTPQTQMNWMKVDDWLLFETDEQFYKVRSENLYRSVLHHELIEKQPVSQPLLMPISLEVNAETISRAKALYLPLLELGLEIGWTPNRVLLKKVPSLLRQYAWPECLPAILDIEYDADNFERTLLDMLTSNNKSLTLLELQALWSKFHAMYEDSLVRLVNLSEPVSLATWVNKDA